MDEVMIEGVELAADALDAAEALLKSLGIPRYIVVNYLVREPDVGSFDGTGRD